MSPNHFLDRKTKKHETSGLQEWATYRQYSYFLKLFAPKMGSPWGARILGNFLNDICRLGKLGDTNLATFDMLLCAFSPEKSGNCARC